MCDEEYYKAHFSSNTEWFRRILDEFIVIVNSPIRKDPRMYLKGKEVPNGETKTGLEKV